MPIAGQTLTLSCKLWDGASDKYVRAYVRDDGGISIAGSPVALAHIGEGQYTNDSLSMPSGTEYVTASYVVYDDAGYTTESERYTHGTDRFSTLADQLIIEKLNEIIAILNTIKGQGAGITLSGTVSLGEALDGIISEITTLQATIEGDALTSTITTEGQMTSTVEDDKLTGKVE